MQKWFLECKPHRSKHDVNDKYTVNVNHNVNANYSCNNNYNDLLLLLLLLLTGPYFEYHNHGEFPSTRALYNVKKI